MTARELARNAFWSQHPLCDLYAIANGAWRAGRFIPAGAWSLQQLIAFAETLPGDVIARLSNQGS